MEEPLKDVFYTCIKCGIGTDSYYTMKSHNCPKKPILLSLTSSFQFLPQMNTKLDMLLNKLETIAGGKEFVLETDTKSPPPKKINFKSMKGLIDLREELETDLSLNKASETEISLENEDDIKNTISDLFISLFAKNGKVNMKTVSSILSSRMKLMSVLTIEDYISYTEGCQIKLEKLLTEKEYKGNRLTTILNKCLSALELRLLNNKCALQSRLELDEVENFRLTIKRSLKFNELEVFDYSKIVKKLLNYSLAIFDIQDLFRYSLTNFNLVYIPIEKSSDDDPYSFYYLESLGKDGRKWKMDCRLEELSQSILNNLKPFMISIFRRIYISIYHDNIYRTNLNENDIPMYKQDCSQLLKNIFQIHSIKQLSNNLRQLVKEEATYKPTLKDKFNLVKDDTLQKKRLQKNSDIVDTIKLLFDNITSEEALDFYKTFQN